MKKLLLALVIIALAGGVVYYFFRNNSGSKKIIPNTQTQSSFHPDPSNASFVLEGDMITLSAGKNKNNRDGQDEETTLLDKFAYGDLNGDGKEDTALLLVNYGGGSGTFIYAAAYVSGPVNYKGSEAQFIGDRIAPQSISIKNNVITVNYLDRGPEEPMAAEPTIQMTKEFIYRNGALMEK